MRRGQTILVLMALTAVALALWGWAAAQDYNHALFLPLTAKPEPPPPEPLVELRALWVTRFDWTAWNGADPARIDQIVADAAGAGFNALFFQVRATADAYYASDLEPWARRASGAYGQPPTPFWDPLAYMIAQAHEAGLQVHAYLNVYPTAVCNDIPPDTIFPRPLYHQLIDQHGTTTEGETTQANGLQWLDDETVYCSGDNYVWATPASTFHDDHVIAVALDIANRYEIDGLHLDRIRYAAASTSCDPVSAAKAGVACFADPPDGYANYGDWQRAQVDGLVRRFYDEVIAVHPELWLSAAVWPVHIKNEAWGWAEYYQQGYFNYYQDSKGWLAAGSIDSISPMIYPSATSPCPDDNIYWTQERWQTLVADYQAESYGRYIIPGIGAAYCDFDEIAARIAMGREIGVAGHALFSYGALAANGYFAELAAGLYADTAVVPPIPWRITDGE